MFQLVIQYRLSSFFCLNSQRLGDVDSLMAEHLQGKLNSTVLGLAHTTMRQFLNQFRLSSEAVLNHEIKCSVAFAEPRPSNGIEEPYSPPIPRGLKRKYCLAS